tara:strand:+ start:134 stop:379 length:246 start_codon:yes stop_codon:yes gene_type:complete
MDDKTKTHLISMLDVYKQSLKGVAQYIEESEKNVAESVEQLAKAKEHKVEVTQKVTELSELLGVSLEEESATEEVSEAQVS